MFENPTPGVDLNYSRPLVVDCQSNDQPKYCSNATKEPRGKRL